MTPMTLLSLSSPPWSDPMRIWLLVFPFLCSSPLLAQTTTKALAPGAMDVLDCVRSLRDQNGGGCIEASSAATFGLLFPYPGTNNAFDAGNGAVVGGGNSNTAGASLATVGGGFGNSAGASSATVGGGYNNTASGVKATVGGGRNNSAYGANATVGGGFGNSAYGYSATVGGGAFNIAPGNYATVCGGAGNTALGVGSFAGGLRAQADHDGAFVWGDRSPVDKTSSAADEFNVYAEGGLRMFAVGQTTPSMVVDPDGEVGIGTASPATKLHVVDNSGLPIRVEGSTDPGISIVNTTNSDNWNIFSASSNGNLNIRDSFDGITRIAIGATSGNVSINNGNNAGSFALTVNGSAGKPGGGSWSSTSDRRLKKNIEDLEGALETLLALRGVTYEYKDPESINELPGERIGFIAQEVENVLPDWVDEGDDGYKRMTIRGFEALAVEALRELDQEGQAKDAEIAGIREENADLRSRVEELECLKEKLAKLEAAMAAAAGTD